jgi:hypothetical protein
VSIAKTQNSRMLEEAADDRLDADVLRQAGHLRPETTNAAHDQLDRNPGLAGADRARR